MDSKRIMRLTDWRGLRARAFQFIPPPSSLSLSLSPWILV